MTAYTKQSVKITNQKIFHFSFTLSKDIDQTKLQGTLGRRKGN